MYFIIQLIFLRNQQLKDQLGSQWEQEFVKQM